MCYTCTNFTKKSLAFKKKKKRKKKAILERRYSGCWLKSVYLLFSQSCKVWGFLKWCSVFLVFIKGTLFLCLLSSAVMFKDFFVLPVILFYEPNMWVVSESIILLLHAAASENLHSMFWYRLYFPNEKNLWVYSLNLFWIYFTIIYNLFYMDILCINNLSCLQCG